MSMLLQTALTLAACGMLLTLSETLLPRGAIRSTARTAIGLLFLQVLTQQISGIIP